MENQEVELFERFMLNQMDDKEAEAFQKRLQADATLLEDYKAFQVAYHAIQQQGIRDALSEVMEAKRKPKRMRWWRYAAMAVILVLGLWRLSKVTVTITISEVTPAPVPEGFMPESVALQAYRDEAFQVAVDQWSKEPQKEPWQVFYYGQALYAQGHLEQATDQFTLLLQNDEYADEAGYYLLWSLVGSQQYDAAKKFTDTLSEDHPYRPIMQAALDEINYATSDSTFFMNSDFEISVPWLELLLH